jgi:hypothetical protein
LLADDGQEEDIFAHFTVTLDDDEHQSPVATKKLAKPAMSAGERILSQVHPLHIKQEEHNMHAALFRCMHRVSGHQRGSTRQE